MAFSASIAIRRSASLAILRRFFALVLRTSLGIAAKNAKTAAQIGAIGVVSYGIGLIYLPAALIFAGLVAVVALEVR